MHPNPPTPAGVQSQPPRGPGTRPMLAVASSLLAAAVAACAGPAPEHAPAAAPMSSPSPPLTQGVTATVEGRVRAVDTAPWAYDGNAVVKLDSDMHGTVELQFPARWNLCRAGEIGDLQTLVPGSRVRATGAVTAPGTLTVCEDASHGLQRLD